LDSQHNRNALSRQLIAELRSHLDSVGRETSITSVLLRAVGPVFCSGADLTEASSGSMLDNARSVVALQRQIVDLAQPVVVELAGPVLAGGLGIVCAADIVIAAESVTFQLTEARLALAPAVISLSLLSRLTDRVAAELLLTGRRFGAEEAVRAGLVTRAVAGDRLDHVVHEFLAELDRSHPQGLRETKRLLTADMRRRFDTDGESVAQLSADLFGSAPARQAMQEFLSQGR
jgi:enoyl-CoA hydratase/methylglutaconyl-CoA hydratase